MKKRIFGLLLALLLLVTCAAAEDAYIPGQITKDLIGKSYEAGKMVGGDLYGTFVLPDGMFEKGSEDQDFYDALQIVLDAFGLNVGVGKFENGLRLELAGLYAPGEADPVFLGGTHALNLTQEGISYETSLLEGDRVTLSWDALLELAGIPMTMEQLTASVNTAAESLSVETFAASTEEAQKLLMPYAITLADFLMTLDMDEKDNVAADGIFPAVDHELRITFTTEDAARLLTKLSAQLEKDKALQQVLPDTPVLAEELSGLAQSLNEGGAQDCMILAGYCDDGLPLHGIYMQAMPDGTTFTCTAILSPDEKEPGHYKFYFDAYASDEENNLLDEFIADADLTANLDESGSGELLTTVVLKDAYGTEVNFDFELALELADPEAQAVVGCLSMIDTLDEGFQLDFQWINQAFDADGQPGQGQSLAFALSFPDDPSGFLAEGTFARNLTEGDGEVTSILLGSSMQFDEENMQELFSVQADMLVKPDKTGFDGEINGQASVLGLTPGFFSSLYPWDYDPASTEALHEIKLEALSVEEMDALTIRLQEAFLNNLGETVSVFSPEVIEAIQTVSDYGSLPEMVE